MEEKEVKKKTSEKKVEKAKSIFDTLNSINVSDKTEKKNGLTYLSWAWAWGEVKKKYPDANYVIYERETEYGPVNYFTDGKSCWVKTSVIVNGIEHIEELPVMDFKNKSIPLGNITSFEVNKTIQRSLTKACARHGLGLYIYAGEDLPEEENEKTDKPKKIVKETEKSKKIESNVNYKQLLMNKLQELKINVPEYAKEHKVNAKTTQDEAKRLLEELNARNMETN